MKRFFTDTILMVEPNYFNFNQETAISNKFQHQLDETQSTVTANALKEFDSMVKLLQQNDIEVKVAKSDDDTKCPDAVFPNNWISFHDDGTIITYPLLAESRRKEKNQNIIESISKEYHFDKLLELNYLENQSIYLEGTGSMILDREHRICYACESPRTHRDALEAFCKLRKYKPVFFKAFDYNKHSIYHTNVMMALGHDFAVICVDSISDEDRKNVLEALTNSSKWICDISFEQMNHFAGNMLQLQNRKGEYILVMSKAAFQSLTADQKSRLEKSTTLLPVSIPTIETIGGGSARCMIAEIFVPQN